MALNPSYEAIGKGFVQQYYALFDDPAQRPNLINMYNVSIYLLNIYKYIRRGVVCDYLIKNKSYITVEIFVES